MTDHTPALVLGLSPTGLLIMRSLGRQGVQVYGADFDAWGLARASRYCTHAPSISAASVEGDPEGLRDALIAHAETVGGRPVLFATSDAYIELLIPHFEALESHFRFTTRLDATAAAFLDKRAFYALCREHAVSLPRTWFRDDIGDIEATANDVRYPAIIKPAFSHHLVAALGGHKVLEVPDARALVSGYRALAEIDDDLVIQEVVPGSDDQIVVAACYVDAAGEQTAAFVGRKLRQYRPRFGSASLVVSEWDQDVVDRCASFLRGVGFRGLCGVEFKRDPRDGRLVMIEVNARATLWMGLTTAAGVDMPLVAYRSTIGAPTPAVRQVDGVKWAYVPRDVQSALHYLREGELTVGDWARSLRGCRHSALATADDVAPAAYVPVYALRRAIERLRNRRSG